MKKLLLFFVMNLSLMAFANAQSISAELFNAGRDPEENPHFVIIVAPQSALRNEWEYAFSSIVDYNIGSKEVIAKENLSQVPRKFHPYIDPKCAITLISFAAKTYFCMDDYAASEDAVKPGRGVRFDRRNAAIYAMYNLINSSPLSFVKRM